MPSLKLRNLFRRSPDALNLRERAAATASRVEAFKAAAADPADPSHAEQVAQAGLTGDVLASSGIDHRDGTVSYCDATGKVSRRPMARWIAFNAMQMHSHVQGEIGRRRANEANSLSGEEHVAWEARIRRELRADAIHALTFQSDRAFEAAQAIRTGAEPTTAAGRAKTDAMLLALAPEWEAARDAYAEAIQRQIVVSNAADSIEPRPSQGIPFEERQILVQGWRERTGVEDAEAASAAALDVRIEIEDRISELSAASLAGLRLKARVAQQHDDDGVEWPEGFGEGLTRDLLAFTAEPDVDWHNPPPGFMAAPAIEPFSFTQVHNGIAMELGRLRGIAWAEYYRRTEGLREGASQDEVREHRAKVRADLYLPALTAAADPGSVEAATLAALDQRCGPDPVLALIEEHRAAYAEWDRLSDVWSEMSENDPGYAEAVAASDGPGKREVTAYDALFAARPGTLSGVAALAEYLREATDSTRVDLVPSAADRGLAAVAIALRAALATREERSRRETTLVDMLDLASASLDDLQALHDIANLVGEVAYASCWQGRSHARGWREQAPPGDQYNVAGKLMQWLGDALTDVETAANDEARRRAPVTSADRETRMEMLALPVIQNGDPDETEAFARELLAHVEAEREGR